MNRRNFLTLAAGTSLSAQAIAETRSAPLTFVWREVEVIDSIGNTMFMPRVFPVDCERRFKLEHACYRAECTVALMRYKGSLSRWETRWWIVRDDDRLARLMMEGNICDGGALDEAEQQITRAKSIVETGLVHMLREI